MRYSVSLCGFALYVAMSSQASAVTTSEFSDASVDNQMGYVYGIMEYMSHVITPGDQVSVDTSSGYLKCFMDNKINAKEGLSIVKRYIDRTPDASTQPMLGNVLKAFYGACKRYLPK